VAFNPALDADTDEYVCASEHEFGTRAVTLRRYYGSRITAHMKIWLPCRGSFQLVSVSLYEIGKPSKTMDILTNPVQVDSRRRPERSFPGRVRPARILPPIPTQSQSGVPLTATANNVVNRGWSRRFVSAVTNANDRTATRLQTEFLKDPEPVTHYKSMEFEVNKSSKRKWQMRAELIVLQSWSRNSEGSVRNEKRQKTIRT